MKGAAAPKRIAGMATCADGAAGASNRAAAIRVCLVAVTADYCGVGMMRTLLPFYAERMAPGSGATLLGALETACGVGQIIGATVLGRLSDTRGRKVVLLLSFVGSAIGYGFTAVATTPGMLVFSRLPVGLAKQTVATARAILADCVPRHELSGMMARLIKNGMCFIDKHKNRMHWRSFSTLSALVCLFYKVIMY